MPQNSLVRVFVHLVWATHARAPLLDPPTEALVRATVAQQLARLRCPLVAFGAWDDHVHLLTALPSELALAALVRPVKSASTVLVARQPHAAGFRWQEGYAALSVSEAALAPVAAYVTRQREHHARRTLDPSLEPSAALTPESMAKIPADLFKSGFPSQTFADVFALLKDTYLSLIHI